MKEYGEISKAEVIKEPGVFENTMVVEFCSGNALVELRKVLLRKYSCESDRVVYEIQELSPMCSELFGESKTHKYLTELKELAKLTGQDYTQVLKNVMCQLGQSIAALSPVSIEKIDETDTKEEVKISSPSAQLHSTASFSQLPGTTSVSQDSRDELPRWIASSNPITFYNVVEHIVKSDDPGIHMSAQRLRSFSGRTPRPQDKSDFEAWRSAVDLLLKDPAVSDLQRSRRIL